MIGNIHAHERLTTPSRVGMTSDVG